MSEIRDRLRAKCEQARGRGRGRQKSAEFFMLEDVEWLLAENERLENDNVDLISRVDERQGVLDLIDRQNKAAGLEVDHERRTVRMTRAEAEAYIGE